MKITRTQLRRIIVSEARRLLERGDVENFSDLGQRTPAYDALLDAAQAMMDEDGASVEQITSLLRADLS
jgi:hypothetical protein